MKHALVLVAGLILLPLVTPVLASETPTIPPDWCSGNVAPHKPATPMISTSPTDPMWLQSCENCCCSCDMRSVYWSCMDACGWAQSCHNDCNSQWMAAENECIQTCPWPIC